MIDRDNFVAGVALAIGAVLCYLAVTQNVVCLKSNVVRLVERKWGRPFAFGLVLLLGVLFCGLAVAIYW